MPFTLELGLERSRDDELTRVDYEPGSVHHSWDMDFGAFARIAGSPIAFGGLSRARPTVSADDQYELTCSSWQHIACDIDSGAVVVTSATASAADDFLCCMTTGHHRPAQLQRLLPSHRTERR
jgi:hypothetical protein